MIFFFFYLIPKAKTKYLEEFPTVPPPPGLRFRLSWRGYMGVAHWMVEQFTEVSRLGLTSNKPCARLWTTLPDDASGTSWKASAGKCTGKLPIRAPARLVGIPPAGCLGALPEAGCSASRNHWNHPLGWPWNLHEDKPQKQEERQENPEAGNKKHLCPPAALQHPSGATLDTIPANGGAVFTWSP